VSPTVLVLDEDEDAREEVADEALRAEAERDADDPRARDQRAEVDPELTEDHERRDRPDGERRDAPQHGGQCLDPLGRADADLARVGVEHRDRRAPAGGAEPLAQAAGREAAKPAPDRAAGDAVDDRRGEDDRDDRERPADDEVDHLRQRPVVRRLVDPPAEHPGLVAAGVLHLAR